MRATSRLEDWELDEFSRAVSAVTRKAPEYGVSYGTDGYIGAMDVLWACKKRGPYRICEKADLNDVHCIVEYNGKNHKDRVEAKEVSTGNWMMRARQGHFECMSSSGWP